MEVEVAAVVDGVLRSEDILVYCAWMLNGLTAVYRLEHGVNNWFFGCVLLCDVSPLCTGTPICS